MTVRCPVCSDGLTVPHGDYRWKFWGVEYELVECQDCQCVCTNPLPDDETLEKVYGNGFDYRWYEDHYWAKHQDSLRRLIEYKGFLGRRVLDFGGGVGYFSKAAESKGYTSETFDPFRERKDKPSGRWDTVVALHVLEHSNNLDRTLKQIREFIAPGGNIIMAVPNLAGEGYRNAGMGWVWAQPPLLHVFHFTEKGLRRLLERHGFTVLRLTYHERWDANAFTDIKMARLFKFFDSLWGRRPINMFALSRRIAACCDSSLRFWGLKKALSHYNGGEKKYAELQLFATFDKK